MQHSKAWDRIAIKLGTLIKREYGMSLQVGRTIGVFASGIVESVL